jgi:hypothetical protein
MKFTNVRRENFLVIKFRMMQFDTVLNLNFKSLVKFNMLFSLFYDLRQLSIKLLVDEQILVVKSGQIEREVSLEDKAMVEDSVSEESLNES